MRFVVLLFSLLLITACYPQAHVLVTNDCQDAYLRISRLQGAGDYDVVNERLMPGQEHNVSLSGAGGSNNRFIIKVTGFYLGEGESGESLGSIEQIVFVSSGNGPTAPRNNYSLVVECFNGRLQHRFW